MLFLVPSLCSSTSTLKDVEFIEQDRGKKPDGSLETGFLINLIGSPGHVDFSFEGSFGKSFLQRQTKVEQDLDGLAEDIDVGKVHPMDDLRSVDVTSLTPTSMTSLRPGMLRNIFG